VLASLIISTQCKRNEGLEMIVGGCSVDGCAGRGGQLVEERRIPLSLLRIVSRPK